MSYYSCVNDKLAALGYLEGMEAAQQAKWQLAIQVSCYLDTGDQSAGALVRCLADWWRYQYEANGRTLGAYDVELLAGHVNACGGGLPECPAGQRWDFSSNRCVPVGGSGGGGLPTWDQVWPWLAAALVWAWALSIGGETKK